MRKFPVLIETHNKSICFVPDWFIQPGFALYRKKQKVNVIAANGSTETQEEIGQYNLLKMLEGNNPESISGIIEYHHLFQTNGYFTPLCYSYHKKDYKLLHRAKGLSRIDRASCASDFYYTNKYIAGIQIMKILKIIFEYNEEVYESLIPCRTLCKIRLRGFRRGERGYEIW